MPITSCTALLMAGCKSSPSGGTGVLLIVPTKVSAWVFSCAQAFSESMRDKVGLFPSKASDRLLEI